MDGSPLVPRGASRRRHPRIAIDGTFTAQDLTRGLLVLIRDISPGGFRTESSQPVTPGETHTFRSVLPGGESCVFRATVVHSQPGAGPHSVSTAGWRAEADVHTTAAIGRIIDAVTTVEVHYVGRRAEDRLGPAAGQVGVGAGALEDTLTRV